MKINIINRKIFLFFYEKSFIIFIFQKDITIILLK